MPANLPNLPKKLPGKLPKVHPKAAASGRTVRLGKPKTHAAPKVAKPAVHTPVTPAAPTAAAGGMAGVGASPSGRARQAVNAMRNTRGGPGTAAPSTKKEAVKESAGKLAKGALTGAAQGAITGGGIPGAIVGGVKGLGTAAIKDKNSRKVIIVLAILVALISFAVPLTFGALFFVGTAAIAGADSTNSAKSAAASGVSEQEIASLREDTASGTVPWQLSLAVKRQTGTVDIPKLAAAMKQVDRDGNNRDLAAGTIYDDDKDIRRTGTSEADKRKAEKAHTTYIAFLVAYGLTEEDAEPIYRQALKWYLGQGINCQPTQAPTGTDPTVLTAEQNANALTILGVVKTVFPAADQHRAAIIGLATARQESGLRSIDYGDTAGPDSRGLFQQRDPWGPLELRMNPAGAAGLFYQRLIALPDWQTMRLSDAAYQVQRFRIDLKPHYDAYEAWATTFTDENLATAPAVPVPAGVGPIGAGTPGTAAAAGTGGCVGVTGAWVSPLDLHAGYVAISDFFGMRHSATLGNYPHMGLDLATSSGTPIYAVSAGTVTVAAQTPNAGAGNNVIIEHDGKVFTQYDHMLTGSMLVSVGDTVSAGQQIGSVGMTGHADGPHLHLSTYEGSLANPVDPIAFMLERGVDFTFLPVTAGSTVPTF